MLSLRVQSHTRFRHELGITKFAARTRHPRDHDHVVVIELQMVGIQEFFNEIGVLPDEVTKSTN